jgi:hypothetical protein
VLQEISCPFTVKVRGGTKFEQYKPCMVPTASWQVAPVPRSSEMAPIW